MNTTRPLAPSSPPTEMAVIGCCMMHPSAYHEAAAIIAGRPVFHETPTAKIWHLLQRWYADHPDTHPDGAYFWTEFQDTALPSECVNVSCIPANINYHTGELLRLWRLRESRNMAGLIARASQQGDIHTVSQLTKDMHEMNTETHTRITPEQRQLGWKIERIENRLIGAALKDYENFETIAAHIERTKTPLIDRNYDFFDLLENHYATAKTPPTAADLHEIQYYEDEDTCTAAQRAARIKSQEETIRNRKLDACAASEIGAYLWELSEAHREYERLLGNNTGFTPTNVQSAPEVPIPLFDNGIPPAGFGLIIGSDGIGKGFLLADMLLSCALGRQVSIPTLARRGVPLRVLYLSYEDSASILKWRMDRITAAAGMDADIWHTPNLSFICEPEPLYVQAGHDIPKPTEALTRLRQHLITNKIDLCCIDPLSACAILQNENDNSALNVVACSLRAMAADTGCAVLLIHHTSKAGRLVSGDHQAARGGSALGGAARWCLSLTQSQDDKFLLDASVSKNSYGKRVYDIALSRDPETGVLREISGAEIGKAKDVLLDAVIQFVADHPSLELNPNAIKSRNSDAAKALIDAVNAKPKAVYDAVMRAVKCGALVLDERQRANRSGTYEVLTVPAYDDEDEEPF